MQATTIGRCGVVQGCRMHANASPAHMGLVYVLVQAVGRSTVRFLTVVVVVAAGHMSFTAIRL